jgi:hypothetical protein
MFILLDALYTILLSTYTTMVLYCTGSPAFTNEIRSEFTNGRME